MLDESIDQVEAALKQRYSVSSLDGLGPLPEAIEAARAGNLGPLRAAMRGREMYRWRDAALDGLAKAHEALQPPEPDEATTEPDEGGTIADFMPPVGEAPLAEEPRPISRMNKAELLSVAESRGVQVDDSATVAQLKELLADKDE